MSDTIVTFEGRPLSEIGADRLGYYDEHGKFAQPFLGLTVNDGETIADAIRRTIPPGWSVRLLLLPLPEPKK